MRGGAIPLLAWGTLLLVLFIGNWIWDAKPVNAAVAGFGALVIYLAAIALWLARRESVRRGPPPPSSGPEAVPTFSAGAPLIGLSIACALFGLVWAKFLLYFGIGMLLLALGRIALELRAQRRTLRRAGGEDEEAR